MQLFSFLALLCLASSAAARQQRSPLHVGRRDLAEKFNQRMNQRVRSHPRDVAEEQPVVMPVEKHHKRQGQTLIVQNKNTTKYAVDGSGLPDVDFDIGESYAGLMPIDFKNPRRSLYFWFFPTSNKAGKDEITIWLNGGPGCSSLEGFFQENGPVLWQYGTFKPVKNPYTWVNLTNMVWVEQPVGTGFSQGSNKFPNDEVGVAKEFLGFFKNFIDTFGLQHKKIYVTGESYAGYYVPYIADAMHNTKGQLKKTYYDVQGIMIYDPSTSSQEVQVEIPALPFLDFHRNLLPVNDSFYQSVKQRDVSCGYKAFRDRYFTFPPPGPFPKPPSLSKPGCDLRGDIVDAASLINPCFDIYQVATTCPLLWDVLGFPGSFDYLPEGAPDIYFDRPEVQAAINAPRQKWAECQSTGLDNGDGSPPSGLSVLPGVIEKNQRTIIAHGQLDMILIPNGTLLMIQNMTWNGKQGFQKRPSDPFYVPYHNELNLGTLAGAGQFGTTRTERGLTWVEVALTGHMIPQYAPSAAYRQMEFLLGRIPSLSTISDFTTQKGYPGN